ncbi:MAG: hypothetical protein ACYTXT_12660 [Nostoc sp.]
MPAKQSLSVAIALEHHFFRLDAGFVFVWCDRLIIKTQLPAKQSPSVANFTRSDKQIFLFCPETQRRSQNNYF